MPQIVFTITRITTWWVLWPGMTNEQINAWLFRERP